MGYCMRLYGKKFVKNIVGKQVRSSVESRDCIIWEVLPESRTCRVRIQGSNKDIFVEFPRNERMVPKWVRTGNSVTIGHRSGVRGHMSITGQGTSIPTVISGEPLPDPGIAPNGVTSGMIITATDPESMSVNIGDGTYRINNIDYNFGVSNSPMYYDVPPVVMYDSDLVVAYDALVAALTTPPSIRNFRYDAFVIGDDGIVDYLQGAVSSNPVKPTIPVGHILIDKYIFIIGGHSVITNADIGGVWTATELSSISINIEGDGMDYDMPYDDNDTPDELDDPYYAYADIVMTAYDQYNNSLPGTYTFKLDKVSGSGDLWSDNSGYADNVQQYTTSSNYTFKCRRDQEWDNGIMIFSANVTVQDANSSDRKFELIGIINYLLY